MKLLSIILDRELRCPRCGRFHVDREEWHWRAHHTHLCEHCDFEWVMGEGHHYFRGVPPFTFKGRARALVHKAEDALSAVLARVTGR